MKKLLINVIKTALLTLLAFVASINACHADVNIEGLEGTLNGLINQRQINQSNNPKMAERNNVSEIIDPITGNLTYKQTDITLPGKDGLDLSISRIYSSAQGEYTTKKVSVTSDKDSYTKTSSPGWFVQIDKYTQSSGWSVIYKGPYNDLSRAYEVYFEYLLLDDDDTVYIVHDPVYGSVKTYYRSYTISTSNYNEKGNYLRERYDIGTGWALGFPSVQIEEIKGNEYIYFHDGTGAAYKAVFTSDTEDSNLENYQGKDVEFLEDSGSYINGDGVSSKYKFISSDKRETYFADDGRLLGIKDRFGNEIKFTHINRVIHGNEYPFIHQIVDSLGRTIILDYENTINDEIFNQEKITITVNDPNNADTLSFEYIKLRTKIEQYDSNGNFTESFYEPLLSESINTEGIETHYYNYTDEGIRFRFDTKSLSNPAKCQSYFLGGVQYPTTNTYYKYEKTVRNLGPDGAVDAYRINERYDREYRYNESIQEWEWTGNLNNIKYSYNNDCTGYPDYFAEDVMPESYEFWSMMTDRNGLAQKTVFNGKKQKILTEMTVSNGEKKSIRNIEFDNIYQFKPTKIEISEYAPNDVLENQLYIEKKYEGWGGLQSETLPLTQYQLNNPDIKSKHMISYNYDAPNYKYFVTGKQWYRDESTSLSETIEYDSLGRVIASTNAKGEVVNTRYYTDTQGNKVVEVTKQLENGKVAKTEKIYGQETKFAFPKEVIDYYTDENGVTQKTRTAKTYDMLLGLIKTDTDNRNRTTTYEYDNIGRVTSIKMPDFTNIYNDTYKVEQIFTYKEGYDTNVYLDPSDKKLLCTRVYSRTHYIDDNNDTHIYNAYYTYYDGFGNVRLERLWDFEKGKWVIQGQNLYDDDLRIIGTLDAEFNKTKYEYDEWGRLYESEDPFGNLNRRDYDISQRKISNYFVAKDNVTSFRNNGDNSYKENMVEVYLDQWGQPIERRAYPQWPQTTEHVSELYSYDIEGNLKTYTDPKRNLNEDGFTKCYSYDELGRIKNIKDALDQIVEVDYTILGDVSNIKLKQNESSSEYVQLYTKQYDELGKLTGKTDPLNKSSKYIYNDIGFNTQTIDRKGNVFTYGHDEQNNLISNKANNIENGDNSEYKYYYRNTFGVEWIDDYKNSVRQGFMDYGYNPLGQIDYLKVDYSNSSNFQSYLSNKYDAAGKVESIAIGENTSSYFYTNYEYDKVRLSNVQTNGQEGEDTTGEAYADYDYYSDGRLRKITYPKLNDETYLTTEYVYDKLTRLQVITNKKGNNILSQYSYTYDDNGNIETIDDGSSITTYVYDKLNRIIEIHPEQGRATKYSYDLRGNRATQQGENVFLDLDSTNYKYDERDRLTSVTKGNTTTKIKYRADGLRYDKTDSEKKVYYHYNLGDKVVAESDETGSIISNYIWGPDRVLVKKDKKSNKEYYYLYNGHGDVMQIVDTDGNVVNNYKYDEWGNLLENTEAIENPFKYAGEIFDEKTGLYYLRARYYDPKIGRFINEDSFEGTVTNPLTLNLYTYVSNNPLAYIDPSGHISFTVSQFTSLVKGIIDGAVLDDLKSMFNLDTYKAIFEFGSAIINGEVNFADVAKSVGASFAEPFMYLAKHSKHVWTGKPSDQEVYEYGKRMGNVIQMAAGAVGGSAVGAKLMKALGKVSPKLAKTVAKLADKVEDVLGNSRGSFGLSKGMDNVVDISNKAKRTAKKLSPEAKKGYEKAIEALKSGDIRRLNNHALKGNRKGQWAVDIKGTGKGRGAGRIIYEKLSNGSIKVIEILTDHKY